MVRKVLIWVGVFCVILLLAYPKIKSNGDKKSKAGPPSGGGAPLQVTALVAGGEELNLDLKAVGTVLANEEVELQSEVAGKITRVNFKEGSKVQRGQLLIKVNDAELQAELRKALSRAKLLKDNEARQRILFEKGGISQAEMEAFSNEAQIMEAEIALLKAKIAKTEIKAPFSGTIGLKNVSEGSFTSPSTTVATVQDLSKIKIEFSISERYAQQIHTGKKISFKVQGLEKEFLGEIYAIDPKIDQATRTLQIKALANNTDGRLFPGAFAEITVYLDKVDSAVMLPSEAVVPDIKGHKVFLYKSGKAEVHPVKIGTRKEKHVQIVEGVVPGDTVITSGILQLKPGVSVKIKEINS